MDYAFPHLPPSLFNMNVFSPPLEHCYNTYIIVTTVTTVTTLLQQLQHWYNSYNIVTTLTTWLQLTYNIVRTL